MYLWSSSFFALEAFLSPDAEPMFSSPSITLDSFNRKLSTVSDMFNVAGLNKLGFSLLMSYVIESRISCSLLRSFKLDDVPGFMVCDSEFPMAESPSSSLFSENVNGP